jgi:hypothetical protein
MFARQPVKTHIRLQRVFGENHQMKTNAYVFALDARCVAVFFIPLFAVRTL